MPGSYTEVTSSSQLTSILSSHKSTIVDFHATWCGPCHAIAPVFEQLASQNASKGRVAFVKVDTDQNRDIVSQYGISAMPTFLVFNGSSVVETIRGASAGTLRAAVSKAVEAAKGAGGAAAAFESKGYRLGNDSGDKPKASSSTPGAAAGTKKTGTGSAGRRLGAAGTAAGGSTLGIDIGGAADSMVRFMGLYLVTLLSFDPYNAAENSPLSVRPRRS